MMINLSIKESFFILCLKRNIAAKEPKEPPTRDDNKRENSETLEIFLSLESALALSKP